MQKQIDLMKKKSNLENSSDYDFNEDVLKDMIYKIDNLEK